MYWSWKGAPKEGRPDKRSNAYRACDIAMVSFSNVDWRRLAADGKRYKWNRPSCPNHCSCRLWGHGRVSRYFDGLAEVLYVQRFRCRECRSVITIRPREHWARYQAPVSWIFEVLRHRLSMLKWPEGVTRQRAGHWLRKFVSKIAMDFPGADLLVTLDRLYDRQIAFLV